MSAEAEVREVITNWVAAVATQDLDGTLAHHAQDMVQFDVPPPYQGLRGIDAYRDSWPMFFDWQRDNDGIFEMVELNVVAGADVAFAYGLLRCGTVADLAENPDNRLRFTAGLRRVDGSWVVVHEHHSFPLTG
jgi:ketosteroid isomerase-like protein